MTFLINFFILQVSKRKIPAKEYAPLQKADEGKREYIKLWKLTKALRRHETDDYRNFLLKKTTICRMRSIYNFKKRPGKGILVKGSIKIL